MKLHTRYHLVLFILCMIGCTAHASSWRDAWRNTDQRAAAHLLQDEFDAAEKLFTRKDWQAVAAYRNKHYAAAEQGFQAQGGAEGFYNQGNALAYQAKYKQAIEAYKQALKREPKHLDAQHNLAVLEEMLKKNPPESEPESKSDQPNKPENSDQKQDKGKPNQEKAADNQNGSNNTPSQPDSAPEKSSEQSPPESEQPSDASPEQPAEPEPKSEPKSEADSKAEAKQDEQAQSNPQQANASATDAEQQAKEQWLRLIPDDPGGLLREKFWRDHMKRLQQRHA